MGAGTANFLREARRADAPLIALVKVYLTTPATQTLYLSSNFVETPDAGSGTVAAQLWQGVVTDLERIRDPGSVFETGPSLSTAGFAVAARAALGFQTLAADNMSTLLASYRWVGAKVEIYLWSQRLTLWSDALLEFTGVIASYRVDAEKIYFSLSQRTDWQRIVSPAMVTRDRFPRAPDRSLGKGLPIFYGAVRSLENRIPPWTSPYSPAVHTLEHILGGLIGMPAICVDTGRGGTNQRAEYLIAGHQIRSHNDSSGKITTYFVRQNDLLVPLEIGTLALTSCSTTNGTPTLAAGSNDFLASGIKVGMPVSHPNVPVGTIVSSVTSSSIQMSANATGTGSGTATFVLTPNSSAGAGFQIPDDFKLASYPIACEDVLSGIANPGDDLRLAIDGSDVSFARLTYQPSGPLIDKRRGEWILPDVATPGDYAGAAYVRIGYKSTTALTSFKVGIRKGGNQTLQTLSASTTPTVASLSIGDLDWGSGGAGSAFPATPWAFSECTIVAYWDLAPPPAGREDVFVYFVGLEVVYRPKAKIYSPSYPIKPGRKYGEGPIAYALRSRLERPRFSTPDTEIDAEFFGTAEGYADDPSGTYTGIGSALVERPCDIAHHLLRNYAGQNSGQVQTGASTFGSFVDARTSLKTANGRSMISGVQISDVTDVETILRDLAHAGAAWIYLDRYSDKWFWIPWLRGSGTDYGRRVYRDDLFDFSIEVAPGNRVPSGIRVLYAYDGATKNYTKSCHVSVNGSSGGHKYQDIRDEQAFLVSAAINDRLDFAVSGFNGTVTLTPGLYATGHDLAKEVDARMEPVASASHDFMVCYGTTIEAGYNDKLNVNDGANKTATIVAGVYVSMEALAAAAQTALNAVSSNWTVVYSRTTRKVTIDRSSGTKNLLTNTGANKATTAFTILGYNSISDITGGTVAQHYSEEELFHIEGLTTAVDLLFKTGANGADSPAPKNCAELLGFTAIYDRDAGGATRHWVADSPRNQRERLLADAATAYGQTRELVVELRSVYDTDTAREVRNRFVDRLREPPLTIRFSTYRMPDVRRGELLAFDDLDNFGIEFPKAGSDGLWAGKKFRVIRVEQSLGPSFETEVEAVEEGDYLLPTWSVNPSFVDYGGDALLPSA